MNSKDKAILDEEAEHTDDRLGKTPDIFQPDEVEPLDNAIAELQKLSSIQKEKLKVAPQVDVKNWPKLQKIENFEELVKAVQQLKEIMANLEMPAVQKVQGSVVAAVTFPKVQKVVGEVTANVEFPDIQKVTIETPVNANVEFPEIQTVEFNKPVETNIPVVEGDKWDGHFVPVAFTDGKKLLNPFQTIVQGNGTTNNVLRDIFAQLKTGQITTATAAYDRSKHVPFKATITTTNESIILPTVSGTFVDLYGLIINNTSATAVVATIRDASIADGGIPRMSISIPANDVRGFMLSEVSAHPQSQVSRNWTLVSSQAVSNLEVTALGISRST